MVGVFLKKFELTLLDSTTMDSVHAFLYQKLVLFLLGFWSSVSPYVLPLFRRLTRFTRNDGLSTNKSDNWEVVSEKTNEESLKVVEPITEEEDEQDFVEFPYIENSEVGEKGAPEFTFTFKFPTFEEFSKTKRDLSRFLDLKEPSPPASSANNFEGFDVPEVEILELDEVNTDSNKDQKQNEIFDETVADNYQVTSADFDSGIFSDKDEHQIEVEEEKEEAEEEQEEIKVKVEEESPENENSNEKLTGEVDETEEIDAFVDEKVQKFQRETVSSSVDSDADSIGSSNFHSAMSHLADSCGGDGFLSDGDFEAEFDEQEEDEWAKSTFLSEEDFGGQSRNRGESGAKNEEKNLSKDTTNKLESLWEHQELIEQLKMEIKKVRATGLPTIFEESESPPKIVEELKPWKIEEVYQRGGYKIGEVHKFYKSYRERMRKLDIFNYQKMYAIGFLQLKDPLQSIPSSKSSAPEIATLLSQSFSTTKGKKCENDPMTKFIKELQGDLEVVYVGQMCLSWEILHWQYEKALDLWESDPRRVHRFNEVAGEFQQFQVLMQRFIEDEPFQGPRVQNYVKSRCIFRNLLQVPVIREDSSKSRNKGRSEGGGYDISSDMLVEMLEESIRIFWRFVRADKFRRQLPAELQKPEDSELLMEVQKDLHKKERKLKEQLRGGNCLLRKLRSCKEDETADDQVLYFFSQVDMKLVARVLHMSRLTTDQLIWCHNKLSKVSYVNRKIHVEPSFLLFPC